MQRYSSENNLHAIDIKSATESSFVGTGLGDSPTGCDAIYFTGSSMGSIFTLTAADAYVPAHTSPTTQYLNVDTSSAIS